MAEKQETWGPQYWVTTKTKQLIVQSGHNSAQYSPCFMNASCLCYYYYCYCYYSIHVAEGGHQWPLPSGINVFEKRQFQGSGWTPWAGINNPIESWVSIYGTGAIFVVGSKRVRKEGAGDASCVLTLWSLCPASLFTNQTSLRVGHQNTAFEGLSSLWRFPCQWELWERGDDLWRVKGAVFCYNMVVLFFAPDHCCQKRICSPSKGWDF